VDDTVVVLGACALGEAAILKAIQQARNVKLPGEFAGV